MLKDRIRECADIAGSGDALAQKTAIPRRTLETYLAGTAEPKASRIAAIANATGVSAHWLITGEGNMLLADPQAADPSEKNGSQKDLRDGSGGLDSAGKLDNYALVPRYDVEASAGHGALVGDEQAVDQLAFQRSWIQREGFQLSKLALISARGDSMQPTIGDSDMLLIDRRNRGHGDGIYCLRYDGHLVVKRLQFCLNGNTQIRSDNPEYHPEQISAENAGIINIVGRVVWIGRRI